MVLCVKILKIEGIATAINCEQITYELYAAIPLLFYGPCLYLGRPVSCT